MSLVGRAAGVKASLRGLDRLGLSHCLSQSLGQTKKPFAKTCYQRLCERRLVDERRGQDSSAALSQRLTCQQVTVATHYGSPTCSMSTIAIYSQVFSPISNLFVPVGQTLRAVADASTSRRFVPCYTAKIQT
jgi:hypothetical protein